VCCAVPPEAAVNLFRAFAHERSGVESECNAGLETRDRVVTAIIPDKLVAQSDSAITCDIGARTSALARCAFPPRRKRNPRDVCMQPSRADPPADSPNASLQVSDKERKVELDARFRDVASIILEKCVNPDTSRPYTMGMIQRGLRDIHFAADPKRSAKQQARHPAPVPSCLRAQRAAGSAVP
jgi:SBDS protein C-terminal domain